MKSLLVFVSVACVAGAAHARAEVELGELPPWTFADTEVATNVPFAFPRANVRNLQFALSLAGTPSNGVEVAFGRDANADGVLEVGETGLCVGWDCGRWVLRTKVERVEGVERVEKVERGVWSVLPVTTNGTKRLTFDLRVNRARARQVVVRENGVPVEWLLPERLPPGLYDNAWDTLKLTVRGVDAAEPSLRARLDIGGMSLIVR